MRRSPSITRTDSLFPYTTLFRSEDRLKFRLIHQFCRFIQRKPACLPLFTLRPVIELPDDGQRININKQVPVAFALALFISILTYRRSEERRVGKECVSTFRSRWSPYH